ncbi:MAG TPA: phosphopantetheine-binding protein [Defluviicoccus sp.]|nr:phosphopantetheine-binding protein [Defluviicoccus sp.]
MTNLVEELKILVIKTLNLEDVAPEDIDPEAPLFGDGLGLDSIDALELGIALQQRYRIKIDASSDETRKHFFSVNSLAQFITANALH